MLKEILKELGLKTVDHWKTTSKTIGGEHVHNYYVFKIGNKNWCASETPIMQNQCCYVLSTADIPFSTKYAGYDFNELKEILKGVISKKEER